MPHEVSIRAAALATITGKPGLTCTEIAHELGIARNANGYGGLSGLLFSLTLRGELVRREEVGMRPNKTAWRYYPKGGA